MDFEFLIPTIMISDTSLNKLVDGDIYFELLAPEFPLKKNHIVYNYEQIEQTDVMGQKNICSTYTFYVKVVSPDSLNRANIAKAVNTYLTRYTSNNIIDISYLRHAHSNQMVDNIDIYEDYIEYSITFQN
jgi:hypothetical protein